MCDNAKQICRCSNCIRKDGEAKGPVRIVLFRGDDTAFSGNRDIALKIETEIDVARCSAHFSLLGFVQDFSPIPEDKEIVLTFSREQTAEMPLGPATALLWLEDEAGNKRTAANRIPVVVTNSVEEAYGGEDPQSISVAVSGGNFVKTVNGVKPDESGNVEVEIPSGGVKTLDGRKPDEDGDISEEDPLFSKWKELRDVALGKDASATSPSVGVGAVAVGDGARAVNSGSVCLGAFVISHGPDTLNTRVQNPGGFYFANAKTLQDFLDAYLKATGGTIGSDGSKGGFLNLDGGYYDGGSKGAGIYMSAGDASEPFGKKAELSVGEGYGDGGYVYIANGVSGSGGKVEVAGQDGGSVVIRGSSYEERSDVIVDGHSVLDLIDERAKSADVKAGLKKCLPSSGGEIKDGDKPCSLSISGGDGYESTGANLTLGGGYASGGKIVVGGSATNDQGSIRVKSDASGAAGIIVVESGSPDNPYLQTVTIHGDVTIGSMSVRDSIKELQEKVSSSNGNAQLAVVDGKPTTIEHGKFYSFRPTSTETAHVTLTTGFDDGMEDEARLFFDCGTAAPDVEIAGGVKVLYKDGSIRLADMKISGTSVPNRYFVNLKWFKTSASGTEERFVFVDVVKVSE